ncbi:unnamed protein product [Closterium sp. Naga37s-1]|nr:unnamed protein product [Closterium sp. Naga37s-1]
MPAQRIRRAPLRAPLLCVLCLLCLVRSFPVADLASPARSSPSQLSPTLARRRLTQLPAPDPPSQSLAPSSVAGWAAGEGWESDTWRDLSGEFDESDDEGGEGSSRRGKEDGGNQMLGQGGEQAQGKREKQGIGGMAGLGSAEQGGAGEAMGADGWAGQHPGMGARGDGAADTAQAAEGASGGRWGLEEADTERVAWRVEEAWREWDRVVGCERFRAKHAGHSSSSGGGSSSFQGDEASDCSVLKLPHVTVQIMASSSLPSWLEGFFTCPCGLTCTLSRSEVLAARPHAMLYEGGAPRGVRVKGEPLLVHVAMEAREEGGEGGEGAQWSGCDGGVWARGGRAVLVCQQPAARRPQPPHRCLQVPRSYHLPRLVTILAVAGGSSTAATGTPPHTPLRPADAPPTAPLPAPRLPPLPSHFLFSLAIERHHRPAYVTEKFLLPLLAGSVPIYYGAPDVSTFAPPESFIEGGAESEESIVQRVQAMRGNATAYLSLHAWRRCGVLGGLQRALRMGFDTLPCRLCHRISAMGGRAHTSHPRSAEEDAAGGGDGDAMISATSVI